MSVDPGGSGGGGQGSGARKSMAEMSKEELIQKCKGLLNIAQKAKAAKDDAVKQLNESLKKSEALEEMVTSLSEQKVQAATDIDQLKRELKQDQSLKTKIDELAQRCDEAETESESKSRQLNRLTEENDDLLKQVDSLDQVLQETKAELGRKEQDLVKSQETVTNHVDKINSLEEDSTRKSAKIQEMQASLICEKDTIAKLESEANELQQTLAQKTLNLDEREKKIQALETEMESLKSTSAEDSGMVKKELLEARSKSDELAAKNVQLEQSLNDHKTRAEELESARKTNEQLEQEASSLKSALNEKIASISGLEADVEKEKENLKTALDKHKVESSELKAQIVSLTSKLDDRQTEQTFQDQTLRDDLERSQKLCQDLEASNALLKDQIYALRDDATENAKLVDDLNDQIRSAKNELELKVESMESDAQDKAEKLQIVETEIEKKTKALQESLAAKQELEETVKKLEDQIHALGKADNQSAEFSKQLEEQSKTLREKQSEIDGLKIVEEEVIKTKRQLSDAESQIETLKQNESVLEDKVAQVTKDFNDAQASVEAYKIKMESSDRTIHDLEQEVQKLKDVIADQDNQKQSQDFAKQLAKMKQTLQALRESNVDCNQVQEDMKSQVGKDFANVLSVIEEQKTALVQENERKNELLGEITEMNNELKRRGSKISARDEQIEGLKANLEKAKSSGDHELKLAQDEIHALKAQLEAIKTSNPQQQQNKSGPNVDESQSEVMSMSSVSKVEETSRMADIESSFEERYTKLKVVAIKLKKKCSDQEKKINELTKSQESGSTQKLAQMSANFASIQAEYDDAQDIIEAQKSEISSLTKDLKAAIDDSMAIKEKLAEAEETVAKLTSEVKALEEQQSEAKSQIETLSKQVESQAGKLEKLESEKNKVSEEASALKNKLESMANMGKKHDLLDLELEEAETRVSQLTRLQEESQKEVEELKALNEQETAARKNRELQIEEIEQTLAKESERANDLKAKLTEARNDMSAMENNMAESNAELDSLRREVDKMRSENERLTCQLSDISGNAVANVQNLTTKNESLQKMVTLLETDLGRKAKSYEEVQEKLASVEKEFESYKVRAQSVLKQSKEQDTAIGAKAQELATLERMNQSLNEKIGNMNTQMSATHLELKHIQEDHERLMQRHSALLSDMAAKEKQSREKQDQLVKLANSAEKARQDAIASLQEQTESLRQNYKSQIEGIETKHSNEVSRLQKQIDDLDNQVIRLQMQNKSNSPNAGEVIKYLEREAAEGSENIEATGAQPTSATPTNSDQKQNVQYQRPTSLQRLDSEISQGKSPIPLELLLQQDDTLSVSSNPRTPGEKDARALAAERRVSHMTSLLSESEAENARLSQLAAVLKEEIRSYQRSEERSKHIENLEYVKNVILKFVTMPGSDEKTRLIPVLSTILRLSPQEIEAVAKSVNAEVEAGAQAAGDVGWSSYLGLWSP